MVIIVKWKCPNCEAPMEEMTVRDIETNEVSERVYCSKCFGMWMKPEGNVL